MTYAPKPKDFKIETITPDKIFNNKKKDGSPYIAVTVGKIKYSVFDAPLFGYFREKQPITVHITETNGYFNIIGVENDEPAPTTKQPINFGDKDKERDERINHLNARSAAVEIVKIMFEQKILGVNSDLAYEIKRFTEIIEKI